MVKVTVVTVVGTTLVEVVVVVLVHGVRGNLDEQKRSAGGKLDSGSRRAYGSLLQTPRPADTAVARKAPSRKPIEDKCTIFAAGLLTEFMQRMISFTKQLIDFEGYRKSTSYCSTIF